MTFSRLAIRSLVHYRRTHAAAALGVAGAVAVLAGSLLVGSSVRESLRSMATSRLGRTTVVVGAPQPFPTNLADRMTAALGSPVAPLLALNGVTTHESSAKRAGTVNVYGIDARFFAFHGVSSGAPEGSDALLSPDLANELGAAAGDTILVRIARPTDIPVDSLHGRREDAGRSIRLTMRATLVPEQMGEFRLAPGQGPSRAIFVPLARLQRDLGVDARINTLLVGGEDAADRTTAALAAQASAADLGITVEPLADGTTIVVESISGLIPDQVAAAILAVADRERLRATPVLTWLATKLTIDGRSVPYSLVSAVGPDASGEAELARSIGAAGEPAPIVLNAWAARELGAKEGALLEMEYYRWADEGRLVTETARFRVANVAPMRGLAIDRRLAPDYPGITTATDLTDWDPPFPIDLKRVRPVDEAYWDEYRTAPKAILPLAAGQALWQTRHGRLTSIRLRAAEPGETPTRSAADIAQAVRNAIPAAIGPLRAGFNVVDIRKQSVAASAGATDFGAYFWYFSAFLMVAALLLSALFFRLSTEQRLPQIGVLRAGGLAAKDIRKLLVIEGLLVAGVGGVLGIVLAIGWAAAMMFALRTWWVGAVGTTQLSLHVDPIALAAGAVGATIASVVAVAWTVRAVSRMTPRAQLTGATTELSAGRSRIAAWLALSAFVLALALAILSGANVIPPTGGFFGTGALMLIAGLATFRSRMGGSISRRDGAASTIGSVGALAIRNVAWRPGRSLTVAGLVASAVFLLVSVDSFRKGSAAMGARDSGSGGFALMAESAVPIAHDLQSAEGRTAAGLASGAGDDVLRGVDIFSLRLRPGDDTSCLNLYQPKQPRIVGVPDRLVREGRFKFAGSIATTAAGRDNPWTLLGPPDADGTIPAIADHTSLQYVLHARVGEVIVVDSDSSRPLRLRIVAALADSVLQSEIVISEAAFEAAFPGISGYRAFLVAVDPNTPERIDAVTRTLEDQLSDVGFDAESTAARIEAFHRVENTYLSAFQALGGLGLVLGCLGLAAVVLRNVLERRRELALLGAAGFTGGQLQRLVALEHVALIGIGLLAGVAAAAPAVAPVLLARGDGPPWQALVWLVPVGVTGLAAAIGATRSLRKLPLVPSLRSE